MKRNGAAVRVCITLALYVCAGCSRTDGRSDFDAARESRRDASAKGEIVEHLLRDAEAPAEAHEAGADVSCSRTPLRPRLTEHVGVRFENISPKTRDLRHAKATPNGGWSSPDMYSGGVLFRDLDGDGATDIVLARTGEQDLALQGLVFLKGDGSGAFTDFTQRAGLAYGGPAFGVTAGDVDGNGLTDLFISTDSDGDRLFFQYRQGRFVDGTKEARLAKRRPARSATMFDFDQDGWLDLYVSTWNGAGSKGHHGGQGSWSAPNYLYKNLGDGRFKDVSAAAGVTCHGRSTLGVGAVDLDDDGDLELYVANDFFDDCLYENRGDGTFREVTSKADVGPHAINAMGVAAGDADGDGDFDLFITDDERADPSPGNVYYENQGGLRFKSRALELGLDGVQTVNQAIAVYWGTALRDFDNDGVLEVHVGQQETGPNYIFQKQADGTYLPVARADLNFRADTRGTGYADFDHDGRVDILLLNRGGAPILLHNVGSKGERSVRVQVVGPPGNRDAIGAKVVVEACGRKLTRHVEGNTGYLSTSEPELTVGIRDCGELVRVAAQLGTATTTATVPPDHELRLPLGGADCE